MVSELTEIRSKEVISVLSLSISNCVTVTVTEKNYILWKSQFESFLAGQGLLGFVNGSTPAPAATILVPGINCSTGETPNPDFHIWTRTDQVVRSWLLGSFSEDPDRHFFSLYRNRGAPP